MFDADGIHSKIDRWSVYRAYDDEKYFNHAYFTLLGTTWADAIDAVEEEAARLRAADGDLPEADEVQIEEEEADGWIPGPYDSLDIGTRGLVTALSAAGCCTATSCNGLPDHPEGQPLVGLIADRRRLALLGGLMERAGGVEFWLDEGLLILGSDSHSPLMALARLVIEHRDDFDACDRPRVADTDDERRPQGNERNARPLYPSWDPESA